MLSEENIGARIYVLMTVLKGIAEIEMLCLNSKENFDDNKEYLKKRMEEEENPIIRDSIFRTLVYSFGAIQLCFLFCLL